MEICNMMGNGLPQCNYYTEHAHNSSIACQVSGTEYSTRFDELHEEVLEDCSSTTV